MSKRKDQFDLRKNLTAAEAAVRAKQEAKVFELGWPQAPEYFWNDKAAWAAWQKIGDVLYEKRLLSYADGDVLATIAKAHKNGQQDLCRKIYQETWGKREPFPDPKPDCEFNLENFIEDVRRERDTFSERMHPKETVCRSNGEPYSWPPEKPAAIARQYALEITQGSRVAGDLLRRAAARFLTDLETGAARGLFFDPVAVFHICKFAENFCGLKLMPWEVFLLANVYGWKRATGYRRFTEALVSVAKKNGKTALGAIVGLWGLVCDQEKFADVFCSATKKEQSRLVWRDARRMVSENQELRNHVQRWSGALAVAATDSSMTPLSSDIKSMDGTRGSTFICDELHMWADSDQWHKLVKGGVSRPQPLCLAITTAGESKHCFCWNKFDLGEKILRGIYHADETFILIYSIDKDDDYRDEKIWEKANPSLGVTLKPEHLRQTLAEVEQDPSGLSAFLRYHLNQWLEPTLGRKGSIPAPKWDACAGLDLIEATNPMDATVRFMALNSDTRCFAGVDIGLTGDTTAVAMLWPRARFVKDGPLVEKKVAIVQVFMPEVGLLNKEKEWGVPLSQWAREGWIQLLPGDITDVREIKKYLTDLHLKFAVREAGYDPWQFSVAAAELNESGVACIEVPQVPSQLTAPCRELIAAVHNQDFVHFGNPVLAWMAANVVLVESEKHSGVRPEKLNPAEKIDGISALANAWHRMLAAPPPSVYLERGINFL